MPLYQFKCPECGWETDVMRSIPERDNPLFCPCMVQMERQYTAQVIGKPSFQFQLKDSRGQVIAGGKGGSKKGRWYRP